MKMDVFHKNLPNLEGTIYILLTELEVKNLLIDLESESKLHRDTTDNIKMILNDFLKECYKVG